MVFISDGQQHETKLTILFQTTFHRLSDMEDMLRRSPWELTHSLQVHYQGETNWKGKGEGGGGSEVCPILLSNATELEQGTTSKRIVKMKIVIEINLKKGTKMRYMWWVSQKCKKKIYCLWQSDIVVQKNETESLPSYIEHKFENLKSP